MSEPRRGEVWWGEIADLGRRLPGHEQLTSLPRLKSWDSRALMRRPVGFALHRVPYFGMSLHAL